MHISRKQKRIHRTPKETNANRGGGNFRGFILGLFSGILLTIFGIYLNNLNQTRQHNKKWQELKPNIDIKMQELIDNKLLVDVSSVKTKGTKIEKLFLEFDIPGVYLGNEILYSDKIEKINVTSTFATGANNITTSETVKIQCDELYPSGSMSVSILFKPTNLIEYPVEDKLFYYFPYMDLHDFLPFYFHWSFNGVTYTERGSLDISNLNYIKKDNMNLISHDSYIKWKIADQISHRPDSRITKLILESNERYKRELVKLPFQNTKYSCDTLILDGQFIIRKMTHKNLIFPNIDSLKNSEYQRREWY
ncbi:MAG: hypothetical protein K9N35_06455 [Candidatus Marinimicrobia bacterium]|nr:hypothetical protein [Candidatus Neomarinimicrobiota bacterium]